MINGFEAETHELTEDELKMVAPMVKGLSTKIGERAAITNDSMLYGMKLQGYKANNARIRKLIHHIRVKRLVPNLVATSKGYYVENDPVKLQSYLDSLDQRIRSIQEVRASYTGQQTKIEI